MRKNRLEIKGSCKQWTKRVTVLIWEHALPLWDNQHSLFSAIGTIFFFYLFIRGKSLGNLAGIGCSLLSLNTESLVSNESTMGMRLREPRNQLEARCNAVKGPEAAPELELCVQMKIYVIREPVSKHGCPVSWAISMLRAVQQFFLMPLDHINVHLPHYNFPNLLVTTKSLNC